MCSTPADILDFTPPPAEPIHRRLAPMRRWFAPRFFGLENVDRERPALYVGNHTIFGLDSPLFFSELYWRKGIFLRSLGDHFHFGIPVWGDELVKYGTVPGTPENCRTLMQARQHILVYPGGGREVAKRRGEAHSLTWKNRTGFARMAIEQQYPIVPFASLGADDMYSILYDGNDFIASRLGRRLLANPKLNELLREGDGFMPVIRGLGPSVIPRPERFYFMLGNPVSTEEFAGKADSKAAQWELRERVADAIEGMFVELKAIRAADPLPLWRRLLAGRHAAD